MHQVGYLQRLYWDAWLTKHTKVNYLTLQHQKTTMWMIQERKIVTKIHVLWDHTMNEYITGPKLPSILNLHAWQKTVISCTPQLTTQTKALGTNWMH